MLSADELAAMLREDSRQRARRDDDELRIRGIIEARHPAKPPHVQAMHANKSKKAKAVVKKVAEAVGDLDAPEAPRVPAQKLDAPKAPRKRAPVKKAAPKKTVTDSPRIEALRKRLADAAEEAKPIAEEIAKRLESKKIHSHNEDMAYYQRLDRLKQLREQGAVDARELLDALVERDGSPWGGDPDIDSDRWQKAPVIPTEGRGGDFEKITKLRNLYVVRDRNTLEMNASLRSGNPSPAAKAWAAKMRTMVGSAELKHDMKLHRGAAMSPELVAQFRPGTVIRDAGVVSVAVDADEANRYANNRGRRMTGTIKTIFEIRARKGTSATNVGYGEVVLGDGNSFRVVSSRLDDEGVAHVVMELVPDA